MATKNLWLSCVRKWYGHQMSMCRRPNSLVEDADFCQNGHLVCVAMGQIWHKNGCLGEKWAGIDDIPLVFTKGTCPYLLCHNEPTQSP